MALIIMTTQINIPDALHTQAKTYAAQNGTTLKASFIAACAGNAEAGWVATKGMIMLIFGYEELSKTLTAPLTLEAFNLARDSILESILIAWPLTRITP